VCSALPGHEIEQLSRLSFRRSYPAGKMIAGTDPIDEVFAVVVSGVIKLTKSLPDGRHQIVALLFPSDFLGRPLKGGGAYTVEAATAVELCFYRRRSFEALLIQRTGMIQFLLQRSLDETEAAREWMFVIGRKNAQERVAAFILLMFRRMQSREHTGEDSPNSEQIDLPLSRAEMADYLGLRIETVSRQLKQLRNAGVINAVLGRRIVVRDVRALEQAAATYRS
jgi:CRP/FNR family transcriptional regulator